MNIEVIRTMLIYAKTPNYLDVDGRMNSTLHNKEAKNTRATQTTLKLLIQHAIVG